MATAPSHAGEVASHDKLAIAQAPSSISSDEAELVSLVNEYRTSMGLKSVQLSRSLTMVAQLHAMDLAINKPAASMNPQRKGCNLHSWSDRGEWSSVCYTNDNRFADRMWNKPREITKDLYSGYGFENAYFTSADRVDVRRVLEGWKRSPKHNALILESGVWQGSKWPVIGVGVHQNVAVIWFGDKDDPLGSVPACSSLVYLNR